MTTQRIWLLFLAVAVALGLTVATDPFQPLPAHAQTPAVTISETSLEIEEGDSETYTVVLDTQPAGDVTVTIEGVTGTDLSLDKTTLTFSDQGWNIPQTVTVTAGQDRDAADDTAELMHTVASADDSSYDGLTAGSVDVTVTDDDEPPAMATRGTDSARATPTLSDLTLSGATGGQIISLSPIFDSNTTSYTASVVNRIDAVTVTATATSNDEVVITNDDDPMTEAEADLDLSVGSNTVTVTVTAADNTTNTYTITVTRDSAPPDPTDCPADNSWCTTMRVGHHVEIVGEDRIETFGLVLNENFGDFASATFDHDGTSYSVSSLYLRTATNLDEFVSHSRGIYLETTPALPDNTVFRVGDLNLVVDSNSDNDGSGTEYWDFSGSGVNWTDGQLLTVSLRFYQFLLDHTDLGASDTSGKLQFAQSFRTGSSTDCYRVSDVQIRLGATFAGARGNVMIREDDDGAPGAVVFTLMDPMTSVANRINTFMAPAGGVALAPDTTYWATVNENRPFTGSLNVVLPVGYDGIGEPGWSADRMLFFKSYPGAPWSTFSTTRSLAMRINGTSGDMSPTGAPVVLGTAKLEQTLSASVSGILDPDGTTKADAGDAGYAYTYQWERVDEDGVSNPVEITGATESTYTVGIDDVDSRLRVKVRFSDDAGYAEGPLVSYVTATVRIVDVAVSFGQGTYRVDEGDMVEVTVTLSADPERTVEIPISTSNQGGATASDYTVTPDALNFNSGETSKSLTFTATQDDVDDDDESVRLGFENLPAGVSAGTTGEATVSITDDDVPSVTVNFAQNSYSVAEGGMVEVTVTLSADPERTVAIPISTANQGGATASDYTVTPTTLTFNSGETSKSLTFAATQDDVDDDDESVRLGFGSTLPTGVSAGGVGEATMSIDDDDLPSSVAIEFGSTTYSVDEGGMVEVTVTLSEDPERTVEIPISTSNQSGATDSDYTVTPTTLTFNSGETGKSFIVEAVEDNLDDDGESVKLGFDNLPSWVVEGTNAEATVSITNVAPQITLEVNFGSPAYNLTEGEMTLVTVTLNAPPGSDVTIPISTSNQGGATASDYTVTPDALTFNSSETEKSLTFTATQDDVDDDDESVRLGFENLPAGVSAGTTGEATVSIADDDVPSVTVGFVQDSYSVDEGDIVDVTVARSADPERTVVIPISTSNQDGATDSDYTVGITSMTFSSGETSKSFTFSATDDNDNDDGESVKFSFGSALPPDVSEGTPNEATVFITDEECSSPIWTATLQLGDETAKDWGVFRLVHHPTTPGPPSILDGDEFDLRGKDYKIRSIALDPAVQTGSVARSPYATPEMASFEISIYREGSDGRFHRVRASDYGDWTLFIDDMAFPFGDVAYTDGSSFLWRDQEFNDMFNAWSPSTTYQLCLDDTPASETIMAPPSAPKYLRLFPGYGSLVALWRVPDNDSHWLPPEFEGTEIIRYEVQIKELGDSWTNASDVLEYSVPPLEDNPQGVYTFGGLTNGVDYSIRVKAANAAGEGPYSAEAWGAPQYSRPGLSDAVVDGESLSLNFNRGLDDTSVPAAGDFRVLVNGESHVPDSVMVTGSKVILTLPEPAVHVDEVHVLYILPDDIDAPRIRDGDGYYYTTSGREYIQARNETPLASLPPVTVSVESLPDSHNGVASFTFRIVFSESVKVLYSYGAGMLNVSGGSVTGSQNLDRRTERWEFTIAPHSEGDVEINLPGGRECEYGHIPCGAGERPLSNSLELTVPSLQTGSQMANSPATGGPVIAGVPRVGETLTVDTSLIEDQNGLESASFTYQWSRQDLASQVETDITGTTGSSYVLTADDRDSAIGVSVGFTDDAGNEETLTSYWVPVLQPPNSPAAGAPTISGAAQVGETLLVDTTGISDSDGLSNAVYHYQWLTHDGSSVTEIAGATSSSYTLKVDDESHAIQVRVSFTDDAGHEESLTSVATEPVSLAVQKQQANSPATGAPTIIGTAQVGETLTADISGISDEDGLSSVAYRYQWLADDADITGATAAAYTLTDSEEGKTVRVRVSFTDDAGNEETLTSSATATVEARPNSPAAGQPAISGTAQVGETLTADTSGIEDEDGLDSVSYTYQWLADDADIAEATATTYTLLEADEGKTVRVRVSFTDDAGNDESLTSAATEPVSFAVQQQQANSPATGAPTISGTVQVDETLTADTTGIVDEDGLDSVSYTYQWLADGVDIAGATAGTHTLQRDDEGRTIQVRVTFTDDADNEETLTSAATRPVALPLTGSLHDTPESHDGRSEFTFELRFSEEFKLSYKKLKHHAFTVTGGTVQKAQRMAKPSNIRWRITVLPDSDLAVQVLLPPTTRCGSPGGICASGKKFSSRLELTVAGPGG